MVVVAVIVAVVVVRASTVSAVLVALGIHLDDGDTPFVRPASRPLARPSLGDGWGDDERRRNIFRLAVGLHGVGIGG